MHASLRLSVCLILLTPAAFAAGPLPGCDSPAEVRATIDDMFNSKSLWKMPFAEHTRIRRGLYERLVKEYPREWEPNRRLIRASPTWDPQYGAEVRARYLKQAADHPDDALALELAGFALIRVNTFARMICPTVRLARTGTSLVRPAETRAATSARLSPGSSGGPDRGLTYLSEKAAASSSVVVGKVLPVPDPPVLWASGAERSACSGTRTLRGFMQ